MENIKILPCPFCGGEGELLRLFETAFVYCKECGTVGRKFEIDWKYSCDEKAIKAWNSRTNNK